jgi:hypothetical protein
VGKRMPEEPYWVKLGGLAVVRYGLYLKLVQDGQNDENRFFFHSPCWVGLQSLVNIRYYELIMKYSQVGQNVETLLEDSHLLGKEGLGIGRYGMMYSKIVQMCQNCDKNCWGSSVGCSCEVVDHPISTAFKIGPKVSNLMKRILKDPHWVEIGDEQV